ncbi:MAG TPA: hypothetical protein EYP85_04530 [Armatimonadetes bacterium]|nr:hypothetical protein [Armatimonadota bacterium]
MSATKVIAALFILLTESLGGAAAEVSFSAAVSPERVREGQRVTYRVTLVRPAGVATDATFTPPPFANFERLSQPTVKETPLGPQVTREWIYRLRPRRRGRLSIAAAKLTYLDPKTREPRTLRTSELTVQVLPSPPLEDIRDIKPLRPVPHPYRRLWTALSLAGLTFLGLGVGAYALWRHAVSGVPEPTAPPAPLRLPHDLAYEELAALRTDNLIARGDLDAYHLRLADILRRYVAGQYGVSALEMTTSEILSALEERPVPPEAMAYLEAALRHCDRQKFAAYIPSPEEMETAFLHARRFVDTTRFVSPQQAEGWRLSGNKDTT